MRALGEKSQRTFYVHEMLASGRSEDVPMFYKRRSLHKEYHAVYTKKPVFKEFIKDTPLVLS